MFIDNINMGYTKNALAGFSWQTVLRGIIAVTTLIKIYFLARLLDPTAFGLFSLITIALGISEATTQTGVNITILQSRRSMQYFVDTAWVIAIIRGLIIGILMVMLGAGMSHFYNQQELFLLIGLASLVPVVKGFINPSIVMLQKELKFFADSSYRFSLVAIDAFLAISLAFFLKSVIALVFALIGAALFEVVISFMLFKTRPRFNYVRSSGEIIFKNAKWLSFTALFSYLLENLDNVLIGKLTSTSGLGIYHNAYGLGHKVNYDFAKSATHSTFPILTKLSKQKGRALRAFFRTTFATMGLVILTSLPLYIFPEFFVRLILGNQWLDAIPLVRWLVVAGIIQSVITLLYNFLMANKSYFSMNLHLAVSVVIMVCLLLLLTPSQGLVGAAIAIFLTRLVTMPVVIVGVLNVSGLSKKIIGQTKLIWKHYFKR
jgi:O-antigen/teichoic acid export membrane protein